MRSMANTADIVETRLDNGLKVLTKEVHHAPIVSFYVWYRVGGRNERPGITGISHWAEHMLFKGTPRSRKAPSATSSRPTAAVGTALPG